MTRTVRVGDASAQQLRDYATVHHGLDVKPRSNRATVIAALQSAGALPAEGYDDKDIPDLAAPTAPVPAEGETSPALAPAPAAEGFGAFERAPEDVRKAGRSVIMIAKQKGGHDPVVVAVNGFAISIRRGQRVSIPNTHLEVLQNAIQQTYEMDEDGNTIETPIESPEYPLQVFGPA